MKKIVYIFLTLSLSVISYWFYVTDTEAQGNPANITCNGSTNVCNVVTGNSATISWTCQGAGSAKVTNDRSGAVWTDVNGTEIVGSLNVDTIFYLECFTGSGTITANVSVNVVNNIIADNTPPQVQSFLIDPSNPNLVAVSWSVTDSGGAFLDSVAIDRSPFNATNCNDTTRSGCVWTTSAFVKAPTDSNAWGSAIYDSPPQGPTYVYRIRVFDNAGNMTIYPLPPPTVTALCNGLDDQCDVSYNGSATISWTSSDASSCSVSPSGWSGTSGSQGIGPLTSSIIYSVNCTGIGGSASDGVVVNVAGPPPPPPLPPGYVQDCTSSADGRSLCVNHPQCSDDFYSPTFQWNLPATHPLAYYVDLTKDPSFSWFLNKQVPAPTSYTDSTGFSCFAGAGACPDGTPLFPDHQYYVRVLYQSGGIEHYPSDTPGFQFSTIQCAPPPTQPVISGAPSPCTNGPYTVTVSWPGSQPTAIWSYFLDIDDDPEGNGPDFNYFYHKKIPYTGSSTPTSTQSTGLNGYDINGVDYPSDVLNNLQPGVNYYFRIFNGIWSPVTGPLNVPQCVSPPPPPPPPPPLPPPPPPPPPPLPPPPEPEATGFTLIIPNPFSGRIDTVNDLLNNTLAFLYRLAAPIIVIMIILSGLLFLFGRGEPGKVSTAKRILLYALIGLSIILIGSGFIRLVTSILELGNPYP